jgi:5-methylcytosine-specific restriction protein A
MAAFLLVWNPKRWHPSGELADSFQESGRYRLGSWSVGRNRNIRPGDRVFLARVGREPRGIIASGHATSEVYEDRHWQKERRRLGRKNLYVDVRFDEFLNPDEDTILGRSVLTRGVFKKMNWSPRASGARIPDDVAVKLEEVWTRLTRRKVAMQPCAEPRAIEGIRREARVYVRGRSRKLRDLALEKARGVCEACGVNFAALLSGKGARVLQVHHRKQLAASDSPQVNRLSDLAVLCANCHILVRMDPRRALPVEKLRAMLRKKHVA